MPEMNGMVLAQRLIHEKTWIVYVTNREDQKYYAYDTNVIGYMMKNDFHKEFDFMLNKIKNKITSMQQITLMNNGKVYRLNPFDIYYFLVNGRNIEIHCSDQAIILYYYALRDIEAKLTNQFYKINRKTIININHIANYKDGNVWMGKNKDLFLISRRRQDELVSKLLQGVRNNG